MPSWIIVAPRHGFFAKDGRGWSAGGTNLGRGLDWPRPPTVRGALCTAIGRRVESAVGRINSAQHWLELKGNTKLRGTLAVRAPVDAPLWSSEHVMWPAPADALHTSGKELPHRLRWWQAPPGLVQMDRASDPALRVIACARPPAATKAVTGPRWWTDGEMRGWLRGSASAGPPAKAGGRGPERRTDLHVKIDPKLGTAEDGMLWSSEVYETLTADGEAGTHRWGIAASLELGGEVARHALWPDTATFAGDRRLARLEEAANLCPADPELLVKVAQLGPRRLRLYAVTPAIFAEGWRPTGFGLEQGRIVGSGPAGVGELVLAGAIVPRAIPVSGWQMNGCGGGSPGDLHWAVPSGAVYAVERVDGQPFTADQVEALWLSQWGQRQDDGFGVIVAGLDEAAGEEERT